MKNINWKFLWKRFNDHCDTLTNWIIYIIIAVIIYSLTYKSIIGEYMFYQDYYEQHSK